MVTDAANRNRNGRIGQVLNHIAIFQQILALSCGILPEGCDVMNAVEPYERIVEGLRDVVTMRGHILKRVFGVVGCASWVSENTRADPARVIQNVKLKLVVVAGVKFEIETVKAQDAATKTAEEIGVGKEEGRNIFGGDIAGDFCRSDYCAVVWSGWRKQIAYEHRFVHQNVPGTSPVSIKRKLIGPSVKHHGARGLNAPSQQSVPIGTRLLAQLRLLNRLRVM